MVFSFSAFALVTIARGYFIYGRSSSKFTHTQCWRTFYLRFYFSLSHSSCVVLFCVFRLGTISLFSNFLTSFTDTWAWARKLDRWLRFFLSTFHSFSHSPVFVRFFRVSFSRARLSWFVSGWILFVCCILVCTSISKCQYNFQFCYDFRPFLSLALTASVYMIVCLSLALCVYKALRYVHICPLELHSFHHFHTFFPISLFI